MSPVLNCGDFTDTTMSSSCRFGFMEVPYICKTGSSSVATSTLIAATITSV